MPFKEVFVPGLGRTVRFLDRQQMKKGHPTARLHLPARLRLPAFTLPIDWAKNLSFPMDGNDKYGDCMYAAGCHGDNTFTGNVGQESTFDPAVIVKDYLALSGGDNGLDEGMLIKGWKAGLADNPKASILDALDVDPTNTNLCQSVTDYFGGFIFMLDVPDAWIKIFDPAGGAVWDAPATADQNNGHGIWCNGVDAVGRYKMQTWGSFVWVTPAGVRICDPSAFAVFSLRWFNAQGIAPNGMSYDQLASTWVQMGGHALPPNPFVNPPTPTPPPTPPPVPPPTPTPSVWAVTVQDGIRKVNAAFAIVEKQHQPFWRPLLTQINAAVNAQLPNV